MTTSIDLAAAKRFLEGMSGGVRPASVLCAVSGGLDSMCLLHLLATWGRENGMTVTAAHFNHLHRGEESYRDENFVREQCAGAGIPFVCGRGDMIAHAEKTGQTLEEAGRELRYAFLERQRQITGCDFILTAHHADDNAETMLLNLLRGTGIRGLAGIPEYRDHVARPFLHITREELAAYAEKYHIKYVEDTTNALDKVSRNVLRHRVLPVLRELNPRAVENMARTAEQLRRDETALEHMTFALLAECRDIENGLRIGTAACLAAERAVLDRAIHTMLAQVGGHRKDLTARHVDAVRDLILRHRAGQEVTLPYGMTARMEETDLVIARTDPAPEAAGIRIGETVRFGRWTVSLTKGGSSGEMYIPPDAVLTVTAWDRDDRMDLPDSRGERSLKRLCSDCGISPAERDTLPVLRVNGVCAAVPGVGIHREFLSGDGQTVFLNFQLLEEREHDEK